MLIYFLKGKLPWQGLKANDKRVKYGLILETKLKIPIKTLCEGLPDEFAEFLVSTACERVCDGGVCVRERVCVCVCACVREMGRLCVLGGGFLTVIVRGTGEDACVCV